MWRRPIGFPILFAAFLVILSGSYLSPAFSQASVESAADKQASPSIPHFNAATTLVLIPVTVTDLSNRFVLGLQKQDFHVLEDGAEQTVTHFSAEDAPLSVGLVVDTSGSMGYKLSTSVQAVAQFLKTMNPQDEAFLVRFNNRAELAAGFTRDAGEIQNQLLALQPEGQTAMLDAIHMALEEMKKAKNPRKAILIVSDGGDNHSRYTPGEIESLVREADVQIYAMGVFEPVIIAGMTAEEISGPRLLSEISEQTGGRAYAAALPSDLPSVAARIGIQLRNQYVLAYSPKNQTRDGKYRRVAVQVSQLRGLPPLKTHWRLGYYAPAQ